MMLAFSNSLVSRLITALFEPMCVGVGTLLGLIQGALGLIRVAIIPLIGILTYISPCICILAIHTPQPPLPSSIKVADSEYLTYLTESHDLLQTSLKDVSSHVSYDETILL